MDYKYNTEFFADAKVLDADDKTKKEAFASLRELQQLMPLELNPENDPDLLYIASPLVLVGKSNLNGDCLTKESAIANYKKFEKRLLDVEHNREKIIGNIFSAALTEVETNKILTAEEAAQKELFNISYAAYIWRVANPKLAEFISMASNEKSQYFNSVSSSFEVGFNDYKIAVGSTTLSEAKILSVEEAASYEKFLRANGGKGVDEDGNPVYRVIGNDMSPRGAGLVSRPASQVKGVLAIEKMAEEAVDDEEEDESDSQNAVVELIKALQQFLENGGEEPLAIIKSALENDGQKTATDAETNILENKDIQLKNDSVINNTAKPMKFIKLEDITANKAELFKNEAFAADIAQFIADETARISEEYVKKLNASEDAAKSLTEAKAAAEAKAKELEAQTAELSTKVQELAAKLNEIEEAKAAEIAERLFNERMAGLDAEFELDDESRAFVAEDIKGMSDEAFAAYAKKAKALFKKKMSKEKCKEEEEAKAKAELDAKEALANLAPEKQAALPNGTTTEDNLLNRMKKAFGTENVKVDGKEIKASKKE